METSVWLITVLLAMSVLAEAWPHRLRYDKGSEKLPSKGSEPTRPPQKRTVVVKCHEDSIEIIVQADLYGINVPVEGRDLHLGKARGEPCDAVPSGEAEFTIHAGLTNCGTQLSSTKEELVYSNVLVYSPEPSPEGVIRLEGGTFPIKCFYEPRYAVDSVVRPTWIPFTSTATAKEQLDFTLRLMTDDGLSYRGSSDYYLGQSMRLEAAVRTYNHVPLRVFVDRCVATVTADAASSPSYAFIDRHGCMLDAPLTSSDAHFLPRSWNNKLHFVLDAFTFHECDANSLYITCFLKALPADVPVSSENRACSFTNDVNRWRSADGNDGVCTDCDVSMKLRYDSLTKPTNTRQNSAYYRHDRPNQTKQDVVKKQVSPQKGQSMAREWSKTAHLGPLTILPRATAAASPRGAVNRRSKQKTSF